METLIHGLIERTSLLLPFNRKLGVGSGVGLISGIAGSMLSSSGSGGRMGDLRTNASSLIKLSRNRLDAVIEGLLHMYSTLSKSYNNVKSSSEYGNKTQEEKDVSHEKFIRSKIIIIQLFSKTLSAAIGNDKLDLRFDDDFLTLNDELYNRQDEMAKEAAQLEQQLQQKEQEKEEQNQEQSDSAEDSANQLPTFDESQVPRLEVSLAQTLLKYIIETLFAATKDKNLKSSSSTTAIPLTLKHLCARVLFKLSVVNFDAVFGKIESFFKSMKSDEVDPSVYGMIEYINFDSWKLSRLVSLLNDPQVHARFKKSAYQAIAQPLRQAIWNWISNYPHQFAKICRNKSSLPGNPMQLFESINTYASKNDKRKSQVWPAQTMILLLCPEIMSTVIMSVKQGTKIESRKQQRKFLESLLKALRSKDKNLSDVALECFVDLYRASTFLSKSDLSALRFLVSDVQNDLQERLMNAENPVKDNDGKIDVLLMVDFFVSAYLINQRHVTSYIFPLCFKGPAVFKLVMTKAMLKLAQQSGTIPWHPTLEASYSFLAKPVRTLFQELLQEERQKKAPTTKPHPENYTTETLLTLLAVFYSDPRLVLENTSNSPSPTLHINDILYLFGGLCNCLGDFSNVQIQNQSYRLLQKMFGVQYMELWCQADMAAGFVELSSSVLTHLATALIADKDLQGQNNKTLLDLMKEITSSANDFVAKNYDKITADHLKSRKRVQSLDNLETSLLVLLCSPDPEIWSTAASCLGDITEQMKMLREKENKQGSLYMNFNLYMQLSKVDELGRGRSQQHKAIRKLLRRVDLQTKANLAAFIEIYSRWKTYTQTLLSNASTGRDDVKEAQFTKLKPIWKNLTAFLCSMGGVCLQAGEGVFASGKKQKDSAVTDDVIKDLMKLVVCDIQFVRDTVTQTIGTDLSPTLYGILFTNLHTKVASFFGEEGSVHVSEASTQFVDQAIYIVKSIIEQAQENADDLTLADFETLISSFVKYCSQLVLSHESVRIKCKLCILIETMISRKEFITFANEVQFRFTCLKSIIEWTSDFALKSQGAAATSAAELAKISALFRDLDVLCMRAIASVLKDLQLAMVKGDKRVKGKEREEHNKREFLKYFSFLSKYLSKSKSEKDTHPQLRNFTVVSLGNLLEANIDYGLEHFMKMAYIEDQETRASFLAILTTIMRQGINLSGEEVEENQHQKYDRLLELLTEENLEVLFALLAVVPMSQQDQLCAALVSLFDQQKQVLRLLKTAIDREVEATNSPGTLFRANSTASKMVVAYFKLLGKNYLGQTLGSMVKELSLNPSACEVDSSRKKPNEDLEQNIENLERITQLFLDCILLSTDDLPQNLRIICKHLSDRVNSKFPHPEKSESGEDDGHAPKYVAIGGVLFLRFLNPAIVTPHISGLTDSRPSPIASRCLILITKIMQNLSNGTYFTKKEPYMAPFDKFIEKNKHAVKSFFDRIININDTAEDEPHEGPTAQQEEDRDDILISLHRFLFVNQEKLIQKMQQDQIVAASEALITTLNDLGKPPEEEKSYAGFAGGKEFTNGLFTEFVTRMETEKNLKERLQKIEEKQVFYKSGESLHGRPVLYFIGRHFGDIDGEIDLTYYHVLVTLRSVFANPFEVVFDCTDLREEHELKPALFAKLHKMLPHGARKNLARVIVYNPNSVLKTISKPFSKFISRKNAKKIAFATGIKDMHKHIDAKNLALPESTVEFESNVESTISPAWIVNSNGSQTECTIRLSNKRVSVTAKRDVIFGLEAKRVDFIEIATINNIKIEKHHPNAREIECVTLNYDWPNKMIYLKTEINEQLLMSVKASIARHVSEYRLVASMQQERSGGMRQSDIPGAVLNMCFLNLEAKFPKTRNAAYNLLAALAEQFDFPVILLETQNMCVPHNTGDLVVAISEQVARAKPFLTTQFLRESLRGFTKISYQNKVPYKYMCLAYMKPWVQNLSVVYAEAEKNGDTEQLTRIKEWFSDLTKTTIDESDIYPALLSEIWGEIGKDKTLVEISVGCIVKESVETGLGSKKNDILNDLIVALASHESSSMLVSDMILDNIMNVFDTEIKSLQTPLETNAPWAKLLTFCRFLLMLSFQNRVQIVKNLPRLLHIITMMVGRGSTYFRATIHALTLNIVHSLAIALPFFVDSRKTMQGYLSQLAQEPLLTAFMGSSTADMDPFQTLNTTKEKQNKVGNISMWELENLVSFLMDVMRTCFKADPAMESEWHDGWMSIIRTEAEKMNPILLPRLLCVMGVVVSPRDTQDHLPFVLTCLGTSFDHYIAIGTISANKFEFAVSVLLCLGQLCQKLSPDAKIVRRLVLLPIILLSSCDASLFPAVVHLLKSVLQSVSNALSFRESESLEHYFDTHCRDAEMEPLVAKFEKLTGISFKTHFSFALAAHLMKGLTMPNVNNKFHNMPNPKEQTAQMYTMLINVSNAISTNVQDMFGFVTALLPFQMDSIPSLLGEDFQLFSEENFSNTTSATLFVRMLLTVVQNCEMDNDKITIYTILQEAFEKLPRVFEPIYPQVMPRVIQVYNQSTSPRIAEVTLALINTMMADNLIQADKDSLKELNFTGLTRAGSFRVNNDKTRLECLQIFHDVSKILLTDAAATIGVDADKKLQMRIQNMQYVTDDDTTSISSDKNSQHSLSSSMHRRHQSYTSDTSLSLRDEQSELGTDTENID